MPVSPWEKTRPEDPKVADPMDPSKMVSNKQANRPFLGYVLGYVMHTYTGITLSPGVLNLKMCAA